VAQARLAAYSASKGGMNAFIKATSLELAKDGITVNAVSPGNIQTDSLKELYGEDGAKEVAKVIPVGDLGDTADIGYAMVYLASDQAKLLPGRQLWSMAGRSCLKTRTHSCATNNTTARLDSDNASNWQCP